MTHTSAYLLGQYQTPVREFWIATRKKYNQVVLCNRCALAISLTGSEYIFHTRVTHAVYSFHPVWMLGALLTS